MKGLEVHMAQGLTSWSYDLFYQTLQTLSI